MNSFNKTTQITSSPLFLFHLHFLFILLISITTLCPLATHGCHEHERRALLDIKSSLEDPSHRLSSWQEGIQHRNCCEWRGIGCSRESFHVISIDLRNREYESYLPDVDARAQPEPDTALRGSISHSLSDITHLEYLDLAFNYFGDHESDVRQFSNLSKLAHLDLSLSAFSASISTQFSSISSLEYLDLSCARGVYHVTPCLKSSSTKWVRGLVNLQVLRLAGIDLSEATSSKKNFFDDISYLWNLRDLDISDCNISGLVFPIHEFHNLSHLSTLRMSRNFIYSTIPVQLANLTSLSILELAFCELHGSLPYLPQLKELDVSFNYNLKTDLTRLFEHRWPKLEKLDISYTKAESSIPSSISSAPLLVSLSARFCGIHGSLPSSIYNLSHLQYLDLSNLKDLHSLDLSFNHLRGPIPKSICKISTLKHLDLRNNNFTGAIPSCFTNLRNLSYFDASGNSIGGKIVMNLNLHPSTLRRLELRSCNLKGFIPTFICNFTNLKFLDLSSNNLTGEIPSCIFKLKKLTWLDLSNNRLRGPLPLLPPSIDDLDLSNNKLNGEISSANGKILSSCTYTIMLYRNELSGSIPSSICSQVESDGPRYIDLSSNKLSGTMPISIGYCTSLTDLDLGDNNLTGNIPNELQNALYLERLRLSDNNLNGTFPKFIEKLTSLSCLALGNNNFEGVIPTGLGSLKYLRIFSLRSNKFNGSIPENIFCFDELQVLDLSMNNLSGSIPNKIGNFTWLTYGANYNNYTLKTISAVPFQYVLKGTVTQFAGEDTYTSVVDLSCNNLGGHIPKEIGLLKGLIMLNLSHNHFSNNVPASIGNMSDLESLDFGSNRLSGSIPQSLAAMDSLGILNLSNNNLSGRIPRGNHFDTLSVDGSAFVGNDLLCGFPLGKACDDTGDTSPSSEVDEDDPEDPKEKLLLYAIVALGFAVGFWGLFFVLLLRKQKWWFPYWRIVHSLAVKIVECIHKN